MKTTEFKVPIPEGMEIDKESSTFECIKFKPIKPNKPIKPERWRDDENAIVRGFFISFDSHLYRIVKELNVASNYNTFSNEKQAKSALAMARISQIMVNDERFGGVVTDKEWDDTYITKFCITRKNNYISVDWYNTLYHFLAFHTSEQRALFLKENEDLVKDYLMIE